jgi:hypothetical protein
VPRSKRQRVGRNIARWRAELRNAGARDRKCGIGNIEPRLWRGARATPPRPSLFLCATSRAAATRGRKPVGLLPGPLQRKPFSLVTGESTGNSCLTRYNCIVEITSFSCIDSDDPASLFPFELIAPQGAIVRYPRGVGRGDWTYEAEFAWAVFVCVVDAYSNHWTPKVEPQIARWVCVAPLNSSTPMSWPSVRSAEPMCSGSFDGL